MSGDIGSGGIVQLFLPSGGTAGQALVKNNSEDYNFTWGAGGSSGAVDIGQSTIVVPYDSIRAVVTVAAVGVTPSSQITASWGNVLDEDENDPEMDDLSFSVRPGTDQFDVIISSYDRQRFGGSFKLNYLVG